MTRIPITPLLEAAEAAAIAAWEQVGRGDEKAADGAAVAAMRAALASAPMRGRIVIGEGERDAAPMLHIGEEVGSGEGPEVDIAVDPLEGTTLTARGGAGAMVALAASERGGLLRAPDVYMDKLAVSPGAAASGISLDMSPAAIAHKVAKALGKRERDLRVCVLDRPRHAALIEGFRGVGARLRLIGDGDIAGALSVLGGPEASDIYMGAGGAPEGVIAAAGLAAVGGWMESRLRLDTPETLSRAMTMGIGDASRRLSLTDMASKEPLLVLVGVTDGALLRGVRREGASVETYGLVMRSGETLWTRRVRPGSLGSPSW